MSNTTTPTPTPEVVNVDWAILVNSPGSIDFRTCKPVGDSIHFGGGGSDGLDIDAEALIIALGDWDPVLRNLASAMGFVADLTIVPEQRVTMHWYVEHTLRTLIEAETPHSNALRTIAGIYRWHPARAKDAYLMLMKYVEGSES